MHIVLYACNTDESNDDLNKSNK